MAIRRSEWGLTEYGGSNPGVVGRDLAAEGMFAYGSRVGFWRILRLFQERESADDHLRLRPGAGTQQAGGRRRSSRPATTSAATAGAGKSTSRWTKTSNATRIARAVASLQATMGERPLGWYCRSGPGVQHPPAAGRGRRLSYTTSDAYDDELPYWTKVGGKPHLVVPYSLSTNDSKFGRGTFATGDDFFHYCRDAFDFLYRRGPHAAENAVDRPAHAVHRPPGPSRRPAAAAGSHGAVRRCLGHPPARHRAALGHPFPATRLPCRHAALIRRFMAHASDHGTTDEAFHGDGGRTSWWSSWGHSAISFSRWRRLRPSASITPTARITRADRARPTPTGCAPFPISTTCWSTRARAGGTLPACAELRRMLADGHFSRVYDLQTSARSSRYFHLFPAKQRPDWSGIAFGCSLPDRDPRRNRAARHRPAAGQLRQAGITEFPPADLSWCRGDIARFNLPARFRAAGARQFAGPAGKALAGGALSQRWHERLAERGITPVVHRQRAGEGPGRGRSRPRST